MFKISSCVGFVALGLLLLAGAAAQAASVTFTLAIDDNGHGGYEHGLFAVYADVSKGDNGGLHGFGVDLKDAVSAIYNMAPAGVFTKPGSPTKWSGFTAAQGENEVKGTVTGIQDLAKQSNLVPIYGLGQEDGDARAMVGGSVPAGYVYEDRSLNLSGPLYSAHLLLAWGAYDGNAPSWDLGSVDNVAAVYDDRLGTRNSRVNPELRTVETVPAAIPEPGMMGLVALSCVLAGRRTMKNR